MIEPAHSINGSISDNIRAALVIAHPGHELCLYGWLKLTRPRVFILTDGSGHTGTSRIESTTSILKELGAETGSFYGRHSDVAIYEALLNRQFDLFVNLAQELAAQIIHEKINFVMGDAQEGYNPTHDVCRLIVDAAVKIARQASGVGIDNFQFLVADRPDAKRTMPHAQPIRLSLNEALFEQKLTAARQYVELKDEVETFIKGYSEESFRSEYLYPVNDNDAAFPDYDGAYYEKYGERRVQQGYYKQVIRYREHVLPLAVSLGQATKK